jgi:hypothetical protein
MLKREELFQNGFLLAHFPLGEEIKSLVESENWNALDSRMKELTAKEGALHKFLLTYHDFSEIEFIISIRDASNDWEEDGIWHDDGSRVFAFSLSLTLHPEKIQGGRLGIRRRGEEMSFALPTPSFGGIILFLTGMYGFEHKIHRVEEGKRMIIAGWCS